MSLKLEIASIEGLDESVAKLYKKHGDKYRLDVDGVEDVSGLKAKVEELLAESKAAKKAAKDAAEKAEADIAEAARKAGDVSALEKSWQDKLAKREQELSAERDGLMGHVRDLTVNATATRLAAELAVQGSADVLLPHIKSRLSLEHVDGKPVVRVLGQDGKPSAATVDELAKEISGNKAFAPLIVASKATGGGASGGQGGGAARKSVSRAEFDAMSQPQRAEHAKTGGTVTD